MTRAMSIRGMLMSLRGMLCSVVLLSVMMVGSVMASVVQWPFQILELGIGRDRSKVLLVMVRMVANCWHAILSSARMHMRH